MARTMAGRGRREAILIGESARRGASTRDEWGATTRCSRRNERRRRGVQGRHFEMVRLVHAFRSGSAIPVANPVQGRVGRHLPQGHVNSERRPCEHFRRGMNARCKRDPLRPVSGRKGSGMDLTSFRVLVTFTHENGHERMLGIVLCESGNGSIRVQRRTQKI